VGDGEKKGRHQMATAVVAREPEAPCGHLNRRDVGKPGSGRQICDDCKQIFQCGFPVTVIPPVTVVPETEAVEAAPPPIMVTEAPTPAVKTTTLSLLPIFTADQPTKLTKADMDVHRGIEDMPHVSLTPESQPDLPSEVSPTPIHEDSLASVDSVAHESEVRLSSEVREVSSNVEDRLALDKANPAIQAEVADQLPIKTTPPLIIIANAIPDADRLFQSLLESLPWRRQTYKFMGNAGPVPREEVWVSATGYKYGGRIYPGWDEPGGCPWTPDLLAMKSVVEKLTSTPFSSVLCNLYRDENDCVSQHCDCEPTMSDLHPIASVSLGATRRFRVRRSKERDSKSGQGVWTTYNLEHGSLCVMQPGMQTEWVHEVPREKFHCDPRINLTFRVYSA